MYSFETQKKLNSSKSYCFCFLKKIYNNQNSVNIIRACIAKVIFIKRIFKSDKQYNVPFLIIFKELTFKEK